MMAVWPPSEVASFGRLALSTRQAGQTGSALTAVNSRRLARPCSGSPDTRSNILSYVQGDDLHAPVYSPLPPHRAVVCSYDPERLWRRHAFRRGNGKLGHARLDGQHRRAGIKQHCCRECGCNLSATEMAVGPSSLTIIGPRPPHGREQCPDCRGSCPSGTCPAVT